ncbi:MULTISPECIES: hypothetical protein [Asticcacaulis]|uniref:hypothetical protein n=1 Tax=Asticcacaulis TaxID=76890 RepID=UPI001AE2A935|nr:MULTISPECIES: hypothetical protein [Asticcacaulis]MBP2159597.1 hypothetical protein [Asticcacaulis solisilvae]MDR6800576.1 hypothetical protein [Asticcacaulis sp. BE141]
MKGLCLAILLGLGIAGGAQAETQLFTRENIDGWVDVRAATADGERGWLDGGFGKLRYGNDSRLAVAQAALVWKPRLSDTVTGYMVAQYTPDALKPWGIEEAFIKWKPVPVSDLKYSVRFGQMFPPVSMEHDGAGWSVSRTLTPSAANAWIGEEVLVDGIEGAVQKTFGGHVLGLMGAVFTGNDTSGTILTWRGWALHDIASNRDSVLPLPAGQKGWAQIFNTGRQAPFSDVSAEIDGNSGEYVRLDWRPPAPFAVNLEYYANEADPEAMRHSQWGWDTRFWNLGVQARPAGNVEVLAQYMSGTSVMGWRRSDGWAFDVAFDTAYLLATRELANGARLTGRADYFAVKDRSWQSRDDNTEKGYAATVAYMRPLNAHLDLAVEALHVVSHRPSRSYQSLEPRQVQTQLQVALKVKL